jgi:serine protease Do
VAALGRSEMPGDYTLNSGPVSATNRFQGACNQINLMLNYGNLGGPVVDLEGRLVGLAVQLGPRTAWRQNCGVAFMLNAPTIRQILPDLQAGKTLERPARPYLGVQSDIGALDVKGARVNQVMPDTAASEAGIRKGDIIIQFNGQAIEDWEGLVRAIQAAKVGDTVKIKLRRGEEELEVEAVMGQRE